MKKEEMQDAEYDHEIEEFLQTVIVEKIISSYKGNTDELKNFVKELKDDVNSIKKTGDSVSQDIANILKKNDANITIDEVEQVVRNDIRKNIRQSNDTIVGAISNKLKELWSNEIQPEIEQKTKQISSMEKKFYEDNTKLKDITTDIERKQELLIELVGKMDLDLIKNTIDDKSEKVLLNGSKIINKLDIIQKQTKLLWLVMSAEMIVVIVLAIAILCK